MSSKILNKYKRKGGNSLLASYYRKKRLKEGFKIDFVDRENSVLFGNRNLTSLFNEPIAFQKHLRQIQKVIPRNKDGSFKKIDTSEYFT